MRRGRLCGNHHTSACKYSPKCVNCGKDQSVRGVKERKRNFENQKYKILPKLFENQKPELKFTQIVHSLCSRPEMKIVSSHFFFLKMNSTHPTSKVFIPLAKISKPISTLVSQSHSTSQSHSNSRPGANSTACSNSQSSSQSSSHSSQSSTQSSSQSGSQSLQSKK